MPQKFYCLKTVFLPLLFLPSGALSLEIPIRQNNHVRIYAAAALHFLAIGSATARIETQRTEPVDNSSRKENVKQAVSLHFI
jgi:hypothetical protein